MQTPRIRSEDGRVLVAADDLALEATEASLTISLRGLALNVRTHGTGIESLGEAVRQLRTLEDAAFVGMLDQVIGDHLTALLASAEFAARVRQLMAGFLNQDEAMDDIITDKVRALGSTDTELRTTLRQLSDEQIQKADIRGSVLRAVQSDSAIMAEINQLADAQVTAMVASDPKVRGHISDLAGDEVLDRISSDNTVRGALRTLANAQVFIVQRRKGERRRRNVGGGGGGGGREKRKQRH